MVLYIIPYLGAHGWRCVNAPELCFLHVAAVVELDVVQVSGRIGHLLKLLCCGNWQYQRAGDKG